jgi:hypothetical protein
MPNRPRGAHAARRGNGSLAGPSHARRAAPATADAAIADGAITDSAALPRAAARRAIIVLAAVATPLICVGAAQALPVPTLGAPSDNGFSSGVQAASMGQAALDRASAALPNGRDAEGAGPEADFAMPVEMMQAVSPLMNGNLARHAARNLDDGAHATVGQLTGQVQMQQVVPQVMQEPNGSLKPAPGLPGPGAIGELSQNLTPQAHRLTGVADAQTGSLLADVDQSRMPTVGDVSGGLANTPLPGFGTVHGLTGSLPVDSMLSSSGVATGTLDNISDL